MWEKLQGQLNVLTCFSRASAIAVASLEIEKRLQSRLDGRTLLPSRLRFSSDMALATLF